MAKVLKIKSQEIVVPNRNEAFLATHGKCVRCNLTIDKKSIKQLDKLCETMNTSRSAMIRAAINVVVSK